MKRFISFVVLLLAINVTYSQDTKPVEFKFQDIVFEAYNLTGIHLGELNITTVYSDDNTVFVICCTSPYADNFYYAVTAIFNNQNSIFWSTDRNGKPINYKETAYTENSLILLNKNKEERFSFITKLREKCGLAVLSQSGRIKMNY